jgi:hypothetical protein
MILEAFRVKVHSPGLRVCIFIASLHVQLFFLLDCITKERKQGSGLHAPRIRSTAPTSVLNSPIA